jgi:hypothetical protein
MPPEPGAPARNKRLAAGLQVVEGGNLSVHDSDPHVDPQVDGAGGSAPGYMRILSQLGLESLVVDFAVVACLGTQ